MTRPLDEIAHTRNRERILDAARALFAQEGFHAASVSALAKACRLTKAGLYHYFPSKQAILHALHCEVAEGAVAQIEQFPRFASLREAMLHAGRSYLAHFRDPKHLQMMQVGFKLGLHDPERGDPSFAMEEPRLHEKMLGLFDPYLPAAAPKKKRELFALQFFGGLFYHVFVQNQFCLPGHPPVDGEVYLQQLVQTFTADPQAVLKGSL
jgi:AcrR family transcriptional regulator